MHKGRLTKKKSFLCSHSFPVVFRMIVNPAQFVIHCGGKQQQQTAALYTCLFVFLTYVILAQMNSLKTGKTTNVKMSSVKTEKLLLWVCSLRPWLLMSFKACVFS